MPNRAPGTLEPFILLKSPRDYVACNWDLRVDGRARDYWVGFFKRHLETILRLAAESRDPAEPSDAFEGRQEACRREFTARFDQFAASPERAERVTILTLDQWRDEILRRHGFVDAFAAFKDRENARVLPLLPEVCREIDDLNPDSRLRVCVEGVFAGNIFDMGAEETAKRFLKDGPEFRQVRALLPARPWRVDDFDVFSAHMRAKHPRKVVFFVDNAGSDFLLGALPMVRWFAQKGSDVVVAANERPTLNDMTIHDIRRWWGPILQAEPTLGRLPIRLVSTGTGEPLIDLSGVSRELNEASAGAELVILEGMGRGIESNFDARLVCDRLNLAMLKDRMIAERVGGELFDVVLRFEPYCRT
jgi:type II pantothenate kinase